MSRNSSHRWQLIEFVERGRQQSGKFLTDCVPKTWILENDEETYSVKYMAPSKNGHYSPMQLRLINSMIEKCDPPFAYWPCFDVLLRGDASKFFIRSFSLVILFSFKYSIQIFVSGTWAEGLRKLASLKREEDCYSESDAAPDEQIRLEKIMAQETPKKRKIEDVLDVPGLEVIAEDSSLLDGYETDLENEDCETFQGIDSQQTGNFFVLRVLVNRLFKKFGLT